MKSTVETARISPRLHRVKELLLPSAYRGTSEKYLQRDKIVSEGRFKLTRA